VTLAHQEGLCSMKLVTDLLCLMFSTGAKHGLSHRSYIKKVGEESAKKNIWA
jgi:hypothetical protein